MRLEISYHGGMTHQVELPGSVCVLGRDPACDVVLNDSKCSRRHAVVEDGPEGVVVRDEGSANGVYVNGRRTEKASLRPGDRLRLGDVLVTLLADVGETVIVGPDDFDLRTTSGATRPADPDLSLRPPPGPAAPTVRPGLSREPTEPRRASTAPARGRARRPATVSLLAGLWVLFVPVVVASCLLAAQRLGGSALAWTIAGLASLVLAGLGAAMALGLSTLAPWARHLQIAAAAVGLVVCPLTLASATVLFYMTRPEVKGAFEPGLRPAPGAAPVGGDATFALSIAGMLLLGAALAGVGLLLL